MKRRWNERGITLVVTILGLALTGTLVSGFVTMSVLEHRQATNTRRMGQAFAAAEYGLGETVANWNASSWNLLAVDDSVSVSDSTPRGSGSYTGTVRRLNNQLYLVDILGRDAALAARQHVAAYMRLQTIDMDIGAPLTIRGAIRVGGSAQISGTDHVPLGWAGCAPDTSVAGVRIPDANNLETLGGCSGGSCIDGNPPVAVDPTINDSTFFQYGDLDWDALVAMATKTLVPGTYTGVEPSFVGGGGGGGCNTSDLLNWGDPLTPTSTCGGYFPIIYSPGDLSINGKYGQGILLVDGDLSVQGGFRFFGPVIVRQSLKTTGTGGHFIGAVMAASGDLESSVVLGKAVIQYSSCAITRAETSLRPGTLLRRRSWFYVY